MNSPDVSNHNLTDERHHCNIVEEVHMIMKINYVPFKIW